MLNSKQIHIILLQKHVKYDKITYRGYKFERRIQMDKEEIIERLKKINEEITEDVIKNATKEEMEEYIKLSDEIIKKLKMLD